MLMTMLLVINTLSLVLVLAMAIVMTHHDAENCVKNKKEWDHRSPGNHKSASTLAVARI